MSFLSTVIKWLPGTTKTIEKGIIDLVCRYFNASVNSSELPFLAKLVLILRTKEQEELIKQKLKILKGIIHGLSVNIDGVGVIKLSVLLNGEPGAIDLRIEYTKREVNGSYFLNINSVHSTKPWLVVALEQMVLPEITKDSATGELTIPEAVYYLLP